MHRSTWAITLSLITATSVTPVFAQSQGDRIFTTTRACTIGFVDTENDRIWTDPGCGPAGTEVFADSNHQQKLGTLTSQGYFSFDSDGTNQYSGDRPAIISGNDELCVLNQHTTIQCTAIQEVTPDYIVTRSIDGLLVGAPAWIPGKGYVGTATTTAGVYYRHDLALRRSTTPGQPPAPGTAELPVTTKTQEEAFGAKLPGAVEFATLPARLLKAKEELREAESKAAAIEARLAELGDPTAELTEAKKQLEAKQTELQQLQAAETEQTENLAASTSKVAQLETEAQAQQKEIDRLKTELSTVNARIAAKKAEIAKLESNNPPFFGILMLIAGIAIALLGFFTPFFDLLPR